MQCPQFQAAPLLTAFRPEQAVEGVQAQEAPGIPAIGLRFGRHGFPGPIVCLHFSRSVRSAGRRKSVRPLRVGGGGRGRTKLRLKGEASLKIRDAATQLGKRCAMF